MYIIYCSILLTLLTEIKFASGEKVCRPDHNFDEPMLLLVDSLHRYSKCPVDTFFDRIVPIGTSIMDPKRINSMPVIATGVIVTKELILTSFNAFRMLSKENKTMLTDFHTFIVKSRLIQKGSKETMGGYHGNIYKFKCARQVIPDFDIETPSHMRHGIHSPLHDLMVIRVHENISFPEKPPSRLNSFSKVKQSLNSQEGLQEWDHTGPVKTNIAKPDDVFGNEIYFASVGHRDHFDMTQNRYLHAETYHSDDKVIADCEEWFPREWGHFICISNTGNFSGIASGAMLFSDLKLFGVGAFALFKGIKGILVFTDVRKYWHLIYETCTDNDINKVVPPITTTPDPYYTD